VLAHEADVILAWAIHAEVWDPSESSGSVLVAPDGELVSWLHDVHSLVNLSAVGSDLSGKGAKGEVSVVSIMGWLLGLLLFLMVTCIFRNERNEIWWEILWVHEIIAHGLLHLVVELELLNIQWSNLQGSVLVYNRELLKLSLNVLAKVDDGELANTDWHLVWLH